MLLCGAVAERDVQESAGPALRSCPVVGVADVASGDLGKLQTPDGRQREPDTAE